MRAAPLVRGKAKFTVNNALCGKWKTRIYGVFDCDFHFHSHEWSSSHSIYYPIHPLESTVSCSRTPQPMAVYAVVRPAWSEAGTVDASTPWSQCLMSVAFHASRGRRDIWTALKTPQYVPIYLMEILHPSSCVRSIRSISLTF